MYSEILLSYYQNRYTITLYTHAAISLKSTGTILKSCCQREGHLLICVLCFHPKKFDELNTKKSQLSEKHVLFLYQRDLDIMAGFRIYYIHCTVKELPKCSTLDSKSLRTVH